MDLQTYAQVKISVKKLLNLNLDYYKDEQMRRRLDSWLVRAGAPDWITYFHRLRNDPTELSRFRNYLTINVSTFFRDPERWQSLSTGIIPNIIKDPLRNGNQGGGLRVWSAGCSIGAEPYSLAIMLDELVPGRRHYILATDLDQGALAQARAGGPYNVQDIQNFTAPQRATYIQPGGPPYLMHSKLSRQIEFREHNLLTDPTEENFDLIVCRNVVIYFTTEAKDLLYRKFYQALRPGGILFVGATEIIPRPHEIGFRSSGISFYQKV